MWIIRRPGRKSEVHVVQAKKMRLDRSRAYSYGRLKYPAGAWYQIDALEAFARWLGAKPGYCFYNNVKDRTAEVHWHCRQQPADVSQMGCTLVPLDVVRPVHDTPYGRKNFYTIHPDRRALPWRCLFHPGCTVSRPFESTESSTRQFDRGSERLETFMETLSDEGPLVDLDAVIDGLDLGELVDTYAYGRFLSIPERIPIISLED